MGPQLASQVAETSDESCYPESAVLFYPIQVQIKMLEGMQQHSAMIHIPQEHIGL